MKTVVVGLGSPHGDDRIGWLIAEEVRRRRIPSVAVHRAASPLDVLDRLSGPDPPDRLIVCDACQRQSQPGTIHYWRWPTDEIRLEKPSGTHDVDLLSTLELAESLGLLPARVWIVGIEADRFAPGDVPASAVIEATADVVTWIVGRTDRELSTLESSR